MHFPNSIHAEGWDPKQQLHNGSSSMTPLHAQGGAPLRRQTLPLVLLGVTLSLVAGAAALSTMFSPKSAEPPWQAMEGLAAPGAGASQMAQAPLTPAVTESVPASETAQAQSSAVQTQPPASPAPTEPRALTPTEPARPAVTPAPQPKPQPLAQPKTMAPAEPAPLPQVIDPPAVITMPQPATVVPPLNPLPASSPASAPPAPQPASAPPSSPASDPPKSDPKPLPPVEPPTKLDTPEVDKAPPVQG